MKSTRVGLCSAPLVPSLKRSLSEKLETPGVESASPGHACACPSRPHMLCAIQSSCASKRERGVELASLGSHLYEVWNWPPSVRTCTVHAMQ